MSRPPYVPTFLASLQNWRQRNVVADTWGIGVTILEVLVGSELVLDAHRYGFFDTVLKDCGHYIDTQTYQVLDYLIFSEGNVDVDAYVKRNLS